MPIPWSPQQRNQVSLVLDEHPAECNRCEEAARQLLPVALQLDEHAQVRRLIPREGRFIAPKRGMLWWHHVAVHAHAHVVDALTGVDGTPEQHYLERHYKYPESLAWQDEASQEIQ